MVRLERHAAWTGFGRAARRARVAVWWLDRPPGPRDEARLRALRDGSRAGIVVISGAIPDRASALPRGVEAVPPLGIGAALPDAFCASLSYGVRAKQAARIREASHLDPLLRAAAEIALLSPPAHLSVTSLAGAVQRSPVHLRRRFAADAPETHPKEFLRWILLADAVLRWHAGTSWEIIATELRRSVRTLRRAARDLAGRTPAELVSEGAREIILRFESYVSAAFCSPTF